MAPIVRKSYRLSKLRYNRNDDFQIFRKLRIQPAATKQRFVVLEGLSQGLLESKRAICTSWHCYPGKSSPILSRELPFADFQKPCCEVTQCPLIFKESECDDTPTSRCYYHISHGSQAMAFQCTYPCPTIISKKQCIGIFPLRSISRRRRISSWIIPRIPPLYH